MPLRDLHAPSSSVDRDTDSPSEEKATGDAESDGKKQDDHQFDWELNRENIKPLKSGRSVTALNHALSHLSTSQRVPAATVVKDKFAEIEKEIDVSDDPLVPCLQFIKWFDETFPIGRQRLFYEYLWKISTRFGRDPAYIDDERMLRVWEKLADNSLGNGWRIFQHANTIGSLMRCARFYVVWAKYFALAGNITEARKVFRRAKHNGAAPVDLINAEEDLMEMREIRREMANRQDDSWQEEEEDGYLDENGQRVPLTRLQGLGPSQEAPVVRLPSLVGDGLSNRLKMDKNAMPSNNDACSFQILEDDTDADDYERNILESVYEMDTHIDHFDIVENSRKKEPLTASALPVKVIRSTCPFMVWEETEEAEAAAVASGKVKPKLMLHKACRSGVSIEEYRAEGFKEDLPVSMVPVSKE